MRQPTAKEVFEWKARQNLRFAGLSHACAQRVVELIEAGQWTRAQEVVTAANVALGRIMSEPAPWVLEVLEEELDQGAPEPVAQGDQDQEDQWDA